MTQENITLTFTFDELAEIADKYGHIYPNPPAIEKLLDAHYEELARRRRGPGAPAVPGLIRVFRS